MKKIFVEKDCLKNNQFEVSGQEFLHLVKVLRTSEGEDIICLLGDEFEYFCTVTHIFKKSLNAVINQKKLCQKNPKCNITLFQGAVKGEKLELITQKCTELGITKLVPFESNFTIAKKNLGKLDRLKKISQEACKQCGRSIPMEICEFVGFKTLTEIIKDFDLALFLFEHAPLENTLTGILPQIQSAKNIAIIVGAEGGFSEAENTEILKANALPISLGERILRAETASICMCGFVSFIKNN